MNLFKRKHKVDPTRTTLKTVLQAGAYPDGQIDMVIEAVLPGQTEIERLPYTYDLKRPDGVTPQVTAWLKANPRFKVGRMAPPEVTVQQVKDEAARRIRAIVPRWKIERAVTGGKPVPAADRKAAQAIRDASDLLEQRSPIPADYADDKYWP